jgi:hypothetical protein
MENISEDVVEFDYSEDNNVKNGIFDHLDLLNFKIFNALSKYMNLNNDYENLTKLINCRMKMDRKVSGYTEFMEMIFHENESTFIGILNNDISYLKEKTINGETPLMIATSCGKFRLVELFLKYYDDNIFDTFYKRKNCFSEAAIDIACRMGYFKCLNELLNCAVNKGFNDPKIIMSCYAQVLRNGVDTNEN